MTAQSLSDRHLKLNRRQLIQMTRSSILTSSALGTSVLSTKVVNASASAGSSKMESFDVLATRLLENWTNGMLAHQIFLPSDHKMHGVLWCPACQKIHGRCTDAVYPFTRMAHISGDEKYLKAAIRVMNWGNNISLSNGAWTVIPNPASWSGTTVFGAISLAETLHYHGDILPKQIKQNWEKRLIAASDYVYRTFDLEFVNINYGITALYLLNLVGRDFGIDKYIKRSRDLAKGVTKFVTAPNYFLYGEIKPNNFVQSQKGLFGVDLGYNVEETLNGLVLYAKLEQDKDLLALAQTIMETHLQFMMPDGGWDNSWGTRQNKWTYWGSRTTDGCQSAYVAMNDKNPAFGTAAYRNTQLLDRCTRNGLLHGGLHYPEHNILPCIHHTFAHAKPLTHILDSGIDLSPIGTQAPLPQSSAQGLQHYKELDVWQGSIGPWRMSVSSYDAIYKQYAQQVTGGAIGLLWHEKIGPLCAGSMAEYLLVEANNQQFDPDDEDIALTPRIEVYEGQTWYTNLYDLKAQVETKQTSKNIEFKVSTVLQNRDRSASPNYKQPFQLNYTLTAQTLAFFVQAPTSEKTSASLTLPIVSVSSETVSQPDAYSVHIQKPEGLVVLKSDQPVKIRKTKRSRTFNMVPGMQALVIDIPLNIKETNVTLTVI